MLGFVFTLGVLGFVFTIGVIGFVFTIGGDIMEPTQNVPRDDDIFTRDYFGNHQYSNKYEQFGAGFGVVEENMAFNVACGENFPVTMKSDR